MMAAMRALCYKCSTEVLLYIFLPIYCKVILFQHLYTSSFQCDTVPLPEFISKACGQLALLGIQFSWTHDVEVLYNSSVFYMKE